MHRVARAVPLAQRVQAVPLVKEAQGALPVLLARAVLRQAALVLPAEDRTVLLASRVLLLPVRLERFRTGGAPAQSLKCQWLQAAVGSRTSALRQVQQRRILRAAAAALEAYSAAPTRACCFFYWPCGLLREPVEKILDPLRGEIRPVVAVAVLAPNHRVARVAFVREAAVPHI